MLVSTYYNQGCFAFLEKDFRIIGISNEGYKVAFDEVCLPFIIYIDKYDASIFDICIES